MDLTQIKVGVLTGGVSEEKDISLRSGKQVFGALKENNISAELIEIKTSDKEKIKDSLKKLSIDVAFIALHGSFGEDGRLQQILEEIPIPYTGSGPEASFLAMDKIAAKKRFIKMGIATAPYRLFSDKDCNFRNIEYPVVVKPYFSGSSFGISILNRKEKIKDAVKEAFKYSRLVILEYYISGRELTVGILEEKPLAVVEIIPKGKYFDFENKYRKGSSKFIVPAELGEGVYKRVQQTALAAHQALGCRDFSRVDLKLKGQVPYVLEVNSIPGLTSQSLLPLSASSCGINFNRLVCLFLKNALIRRKVFR